VDCDLTGFQTINPCGYAGLEMVRLSDLLDTIPSLEDLYQKCQQFITEKQVFANISVEADQ
jgi:lipoyl(octanoyl) transferase